MLAEDITVLMNMIPREEEKRVNENHEAATIKGGAFQGYDTPFGIGRLEGVDQGRGDVEWVVSKEMYKWDSVFHVCIHFILYIASYLTIFWYFFL